LLFNYRGISIRAAKCPFALEIIGKAGRIKSKSAEAWAGIYDTETNDLLAKANVLLINVPDEQFDKSRLNELGWMVYTE